MAHKILNKIQCYLVPGLVFQSVLVGGGYGRGREVVEFFMSNGPIGGLLGMLASCLVWGFVLAVAFEFARKTESYNYRTFFQNLLGPFWPLFEVIYLLIALLVLAVIGSASEEIVANNFDIPGVYGSLLLMFMVGVLAFFGSKAIESFLTLWSVLLFSTYFVLLVWSLDLSGERILNTFETSHANGSWLFDGIKYAAYNLTALAAVFFVVPRFQTSKQAICAGLIAGILAIIPGVFVFVSLLASYPEILETSVPILTILKALEQPWLFIIFQIMLFGTFIETGTGIIHAINERVANTFADNRRELPNWIRGAIALSALCFATFLAERYGIISLIANGYGLLSYGFIAVVILPLMFIGLKSTFKSKEISRR